MASPSLPRVPGPAFVLAALATLLLAPAAHALRVVNWNLTNYPSVLVPARQPYMRTVMLPLEADIVVSQELQSQAGVDSFLTNVLNVNEPGEWAAAPFVNGNDTDNALFYKTARVQFLGGWWFYPNPANLLRLVNVYRLKPVGYSSAAAEFRVYSQHLKASTGSTNEAQRYAEAIGIRDSMNAAPDGTAMILCGDFNIYKTYENAYKHFLRSLADNSGQLEDVKNPTPDTTSWTWNSAGFAAFHTQCPCVTCPTGSGFSGGGLDDRFDMFLTTYNLSDGQGLDLLPSTYIPVGNDGLHYNLNINDPPVIPEGAAYANALWNASDHLPVRVDLQVPARISKPALLAFSTVIVGAPTPSQDLSIGNPATPPADSLNCTFIAPAGFGAPGPLAVAAGASTPATLTMSTAAVGSHSGLLTINCDAPDSLVNYVNLMGTVLAHAQASLDSATVVLGDTLDFGEHLAGGFGALEAPIWNVGYDPLQARLYVSGAQITGGAGRFSIPGFSPALITVGTDVWQVQFNDAGATTDSTYEATLVYQSADEPLPGATSQPDVHYLLRARVAGGSVAVEPTLPGSTRLYPPAPNPLASGTTLRFDLARAARARLEIFDLSGRRVTTLADQEFTPGRYSLRWDGHDDAGAAAGAGLYFVRLTAPGMGAQMARLVIVR